METITYIPSQKKIYTKDKKQMLTETLNSKNWDEGCNSLFKWISPCR